MRLPLLALTLAALAGSPTAAAQLPEEVARRLDAAGIPREAMGVSVQRVSDGATLLAHNPGLPMQPASTLKVVTAWAALEKLGPAWRGSAELRAQGRIAGGVLHGDLYLKGMADVDLGWAALEGMLRTARLHGIREIRGDLVLDRSLFRPARTDLGLAPFDGEPEFRYNVIPDALSLNMNLVEVRMVADRERVAADIAPPLDGVTIASDFVLVDRGCDDWEDGWRYPTIVEHVRGGLQVRLQGEFPRDCAAATDINVIERGEFAGRLFKALWARLGGTWEGRVREGVAPELARIIAVHRSRPLAELLHDIVKRSDNPVTRVVFLAIGAAAGPGCDATTAECAAREVRSLFAARGIPTEGLVLENGSGLSRRERVKPAQLAAVLRVAAAGPWAPELAANLPVAAVDGGMARRLNGSPAAASARLKTGTLRDSSALAGYVKHLGGETYAVAAIIDHPLATKRTARPILDALVDSIARGRAGSPP